MEIILSIHMNKELFIIEQEENEAMIEQLEQIAKAAVMIMRQQIKKSSDEMEALKIK